jgi:flagellar hook-length control protein FliK
MLSLLTSAAPPKAATGTAPEAQPGGRAHESSNGGGSFARALQDSSAALKQSQATDASPNAADRAEPSHPTEPRGSRRAGPGRMPSHGVVGRTPPARDRSATPDGGRAEAEDRRAGLPGSDDPRDAAELSDAAAANAAGILPTAPLADASAPALVPMPAPAAAAAAAAVAAAADGQGQDTPLAPASAAGVPAAARTGVPRTLPEPGRSTDTDPTPVAGTVGNGSTRPADSSAAFEPDADSADGSDPGPAAPRGADGALPDGAAAVATHLSPLALPGAAAIPTTAAVAPAGTAPATPGAVPAAVARTDAARRLTAGAARLTPSSEARGAAGEGRGTAGRGESMTDSGSAGTAAPSSPAATAAAEPRTARPPSAEPGRPGAHDVAIDRAGSEGTGASTPSAAASATPAGGAAMPRFAEQLQAAMPAAPVATTPATAGGSTAGAAHALVGAPLQSPEFPPAFGAQISLFARNGIERATIEINPPEMGPISVQIALDGSGARVDFLADAAATRQVIEAALPTLASSLREAGLTLTGGGVFQQPQSSAGSAGQGGSGQPGQGQGGRPGAPADDGGAGTGGPATVLRTGARRGLVDLVA